MTKTEDVERWPVWWANLYAWMSSDPPSNREVVALAAPGPDDTVLDVGCGAGAAVRRAAARGAVAIGVDPSPGMVEAARRRSRDHASARFEVGHAADLPLDDDGVTIAWTISAFHHWPDRGAGLREIRRVLVPGGRLLIAESRIARFGSHGLRDADVDGVAGLLTDVGYRDVATWIVRPRFARMWVVTAVA